MKKITFILISFTSALFFAQEKKINFSKVLNYDFIAENEPASSQNVATMFANTSGEFLLSFVKNYDNASYFSGKSGFTPVEMRSDNKIVLSLHSYYSVNKNKKKVTSSDITFEKLNTKDNILGYSCNNYIVTVVDHFADSKEVNNGIDPKMQFCIDETNSLNNTPLIIALLNETGNSKIALPKIKGLILKIQPDVARKNEFIMLRSLKDTKYNVNFDQIAAEKLLQKKLDSMNDVTKTRKEILK